MKLHRRLSALASAVVLTLSMLPLHADSVGAADGKTYKIMPLGDSITYGMADEGGYRKYLDVALKQKGCTNFDFVGPEGSDTATFNYHGQTLTYDDNHAGYSGYTITDLAGGWFGKLNGILETMQNGDYIRKYAPDMILLQIGTNDVSNGYLDGSEERLHKLLDYLLENMPSGGTIFLTTIPDLGASMWGGGDNTANIASYNTLVKKVAGEYSSKGVVFADIHSVINASNDLADGVHPNAGGYEKMGNYWAETIAPYLSGSGSVTPTLTSDSNVLGDLNGDGKLTASDLSLLKRGILKSDSSSSFKKTADVNNSGKVTAADAEMLHDFLTGKIKAFSQGEPDGPSQPVTYEKSYNFPSVSSIQSSKDVPDPFVFMDGSKVESQDDWWKRQSEISCMYEYYMYGVWRDGSDDEVTYKINGSQMTINIKRKSTGKTTSFPANINLPNSVRHEGGAPVIIGMHSGISEKTAQSLGYAVITIGGDMFSNPVASDDMNHKGAFYDLYPYGSDWKEQTGVLMAWSWGCSKILDALYNGAAKELNINPDSSIVTGVSRWGKATAVCGAFDKRFKMVAPSCSGAGGLALYRYSSVGKTYDFSSKGGSSSYRYSENEPLGSLQATGERGWFNNRFMEFRSGESFPMDQHMLGSLVADPNRYLFIIGSCENEDWVNAPSVWMSYLGMKHVWDYLGISDNLAINIHRTGHAVIEEDVKYMCQYFDYHVYGIQPSIDLSILQTSVFALPKNHDTYADTFTSKWLY